MYRVHGWFELVSSYDDHGSTGREAEASAGLKLFAQRFAGSNVEVRWPQLNGAFFLTITGSTNRPRTDSDDLHALLIQVAEQLPESWGVLYEIDDERIDAPGRKACRVHVMTRGVLTERVDPFFSPMVPVVEEPESWWVEEQENAEQLRGIDV